MTKRYDWSKLPEGTVGVSTSLIRMITSATGYYDFHVNSGDFLVCQKVDDPDAAAEAYAKLRAAAKACEVTWRSEWQEATGMFLHDLCDGVALSDSGLSIQGNATRKHRVVSYGPSAAPASAVKRIAQIAEKLEALGWEAG